MTKVLVDSTIVGPLPNDMLIWNHHHPISYYVDPALLRISFDTCGSLRLGAGPRLHG